MIEGWTQGEKIFSGALGLGVFGVMFRIGLTMLGRQGLITAGDQSQKDLIASLSAERSEWRALYEKKDEELTATRADKQREETIMREQHRDNMELLGELRLQNKILRMLLIQRGMTQEELEASLVLITP